MEREEKPSPKYRKRPAPASKCPKLMTFTQVCANVKMFKAHDILPRYATKTESDLKKDTAASFCLAH